MKSSKSASGGQLARSVFAGEARDLPKKKGTLLIGEFVQEMVVENQPAKNKFVFHDRGQRAEYLLSDDTSQWILSARSYDPAAHQVPVRMVSGQAVSLRQCREDDILKSLTGWGWWGGNLHQLDVHQIDSTKEIDEAFNREIKNLLDQHYGDGKVLYLLGKYIFQNIEKFLSHPEPQSREKCSLFTPELYRSFSVSRQLVQDKATLPFPLQESLPIYKIIIKGGGTLQNIRKHKNLTLFFEGYYTKNFESSLCQEHRESVYASKPPDIMNKLIDPPLAEVCSPGIECLHYTISGKITQVREKEPWFSLTYKNTVTVKERRSLSPKHISEIAMLFDAVKTSSQAKKNEKAVKIFEEIKKTGRLDSRVEEVCESYFASLEKEHQIHWLEDTNFAQALQQAKERERPLLLIADQAHCAMCVALEKNVLEKKALEKFIKENKVLCLKRNAILDGQEIKHLHIRGTPTLILFNAEGQPLEKIEGYQPVNIVVQMLRQALKGSPEER